MGGDRGGVWVEDGGEGINKINGPNKSGLGGLIKAELKRLQGLEIRRREALQRDTEPLSLHSLTPAKLSRCYLNHPTSTTAKE